jgi:hypothetical protein
MKNLSGSRGWEYAYRKDLEQLIADLRDGLEGGDERKSCDVETYHYICGKIHGIRVAISKLTEMQARFNLDRDEDLVEANL